ncbi:GtrA family protein [Achromobacter sp. LC458]|nr:GtrA family protein [Achromobacter sp. LC458]
MMKAFMNKQFTLFVVTGGIAAAANFGSRILYNRWVDFSTAVILAYITGMIVAFLLAKAFVFKESTQSTNKSVMYFIIVNMFAVLQTWLISMGLALYLLPALGIKMYVHELAHAAGVVAPVFTSYLGHKHFSFR